MFTAGRVKALPSSVVEADKADGSIKNCLQAALDFGSDRREPKPYRPVVLIRNEGSRVVVLPCTTKDKTGYPSFFELINDQMVWWMPPRPHDNRRSFVNDRYEVIDGENLKNKIGFMPQPARIDLLNWLKSRY